MLYASFRIISGYCFFWDSPFSVWDSPPLHTAVVMSLLSDTENCGLRMRRECWERFPHHRGLAIPTCIAARAWRTCPDACRDRKLAVSFEFVDGENVPGIPGAWATRNFTYLVRGPCCARWRHDKWGVSLHLESSPNEFSWSPFN